MIQIEYCDPNICICLRCRPKKCYECPYPCQDYDKAPCRIRQKQQTERGLPK